MDRAAYGEANDSTLIKIKALWVVMRLGKVWGFEDGNGGCAKVCQERYNSRQERYNSRQERYNSRLFGRRAQMTPRLAGLDRAAHGDANDSTLSKIEALWVVEPNHQVWGLDVASGRSIIINLGA
jgi:hypothetical protein